MESNNALKLVCGICGGRLRVLGKIHHYLHTQCEKCGADSAPQITKATTDKNNQFHNKPKRRTTSSSGTFDIAVIRLKNRRVG